jgi:hypothetical protein
MTKNDYLIIAQAINRARYKKIPAKLMIYQVEMEIAGSIARIDKSFDYRWFFRECSK